MTARERQLAEKRDELEKAREALVSLGATPGTSRMNGKLHGQRVDSNVRQAARLVANVERLEREVRGLQRAPLPEPGSFTPESLAGKRFIRTKHDWYEVVKVNRSSVRVKSEPGVPGSLDVIQIKKIIEAR